MENDNKQELQEKYYKMQMLDQQIKQVQKQLQMIENQVLELMTTKQGLGDLKNTKIGSELLVPIASGIFVRSKLEDCNDVVINVGANVAVKKNISDADKLLDKQVSEVKVVQEQLTKDMEKMIIEAQKIEGEINTIPK